MEDLERVLTTLALGIKKLRKKEAPTSLGFDDFAFIFAMYQSQFLTFRLKAEDFSGYLKKHPLIPEDARMEPDQVNVYLDSLAQPGMINGDPEKGYEMIPSLTRAISGNYLALKESELDESAIEGIVMYALSNKPSSSITSYSKPPTADSYKPTEIKTVLVEIRSMGIDWVKGNKTYGNLLEQGLKQDPPIINQKEVDDAQFGFLTTRANEALKNIECMGLEWIKNSKAHAPHLQWGLDKGIFNADKIEQANTLYKSQR